MSDYAHWAHMAAVNRQLSELREISAQFREQQNVQRQQAVLADVLFRTEQRAKQLTVVAANDPLAAAMLSEEWLQSLAFISPEMFHQVEQKRAWSASASRLQKLWGPLNEPSARATARQYQAAVGEARRLCAQLGPNDSNVEARVEALKKEHLDAERRSRRALRMFAGFAVATVVLPVLIGGGAAIGASIFEADRADAQATAGCAGTLIFFAGLIGFIGGLYELVSWWGLRAEASRAIETLTRYVETLRHFQAFDADPNYGGAVRRFNAEHPAYSRPLPNVDDMAPWSGVGAESPHVVERQTVVTRCRYCRAMTPVDGATCQGCGAANFS